MLNWLGRLLQLPEEFLNLPGSSGGGCIQVSVYIIIDTEEEALHVLYTI